MKNKFGLIFGMLALVLALSLVFGSCATASGGGDLDRGGNVANTDPKTIKITGLAWPENGWMWVYLSEGPQLFSSSHFSGSKGISSSDLEITVDFYRSYDISTDQEMYDITFTGSGKYYVWVQIWTESIEQGRQVFFYAVDGGSSVPLGQDVNYNNTDGITPIDIKETVTTLDWSRFVYRGIDAGAG
jgi:predicted small secreted protein